MFRTALTQLSTLSVAGVTFNYDVDALPETLIRGQLPALLVLPIETEAERSLVTPHQGEGFSALAFANSSRTVTYRVSHLLLVAPAGSASGLRSHLPGLIDLIDAYFDALAGDVTLDDNLREPARVRVAPGIYRYGGVDYIGCTFRHIWHISV